MSRAREILGDLVSYEEVAAIHSLEPPAIEKGEIPRFIHCPLYQKAQARIDSAMERHRHRVQQADERVRQSQEHIASLEEASGGMGQAGKGGESGQPVDAGPQQRCFGGLLQPGRGPAQRSG